jgi:hypothetical protein
MGFFDKEPYEEEYEGFKIKQCSGQHSAFYEVKPAKQGNIPDVLVGKYTSPNKAKEVINIWLRQKTPKVRKPVNATN